MGFVNRPSAETPRPKWELVTRLLQQSLTNGFAVPLPFATSTVAHRMLGSRVASAKVRLRTRKLPTGILVGWLENRETISA